MTETYESDLGVALVVAVVAAIAAWLLPWTEGNGNVTLLLAGTAAAFLARWLVFGRPATD